MRLRIFLASILIFTGIVSLPKANAADPSAPQGISEDLWTMYKEVALWDIEGAKRNLKWNRPVPYFIKGNSSQSDSSAINDNLYKIASNCPNIKPGFSTSEPNEGVILQYLPAAKFSEVIPNSPSTATSSYAMYTYYLKRGLTKFQALIDDGITDQSYRNWLAHVRVSQGFGFGGYSSNLDSTFFINKRTSNGYVELSEIDKQFIAFYCSTLVRSWDSIQETKDYIDSLVSKDPTLFASYSNSLKVTATNYGFEIEIRPSGDLAIQNGVDAIYYRVADLNGNIVKSGYLDISENVFALQTLQIEGLASNKTYKIGISNQNKRGYGTLQEISERTINITTSAPPIGSNTKPTPPDTSQAALDAKAATLKSLAAFEASKASCKNFYDQNSNLSEIESEAIDFIVNNSKILEMCDSQDPDVDLIRNDLKVGGSFDDYNNMTDGLNISSEAIDEVTAELQDATQNLIKIGMPFVNIVARENQLQDGMLLINSKLSKYPSGFRNTLQKGANWKKLISLGAKSKKAQEAFDKYVDSIKNLERVIDIETTLDETSDLTNFVLAKSDVEAAIDSVLKSIPNYLCVKNNSIFNTGKSGKCAAGFKKITAN